MSDKTLTQALDAVLAPIDLREARLAAVVARLSSERVWDELAREDPDFAAERRKARRERKAWRKARNELSDEIGRLTIPFVVAALNSKEEPAHDAACAVVKIADWLFENDAPADLIRDFLRAVQYWIPE